MLENKIPLKLIVDTDNEKHVSLGHEIMMAFKVNECIYEKTTGTFSVRPLIQFF